MPSVRATWMAGLLAAAAVLAVGELAAAIAPARYDVRAGAAGTAIAAEFHNFNDDRLAVAFELPAAAVRDAMAELGYAVAERKALLAACAAEGCGQAEFDRRVAEFYRGRGLVPQRQPDGRTQLHVDVAAAVQRNAPRVRPLAVALDRVIAARGYGPDQALGAVVALVQTALAYRQPPRSEHGRDILGFYPPPRVLETGAGDCDSKAALLAAILKSFAGAHMVGVHLPGHYLVGAARVPRSGDAFVEYHGERYVLIEPSGPGWMPPGLIAEETRLALEAAQGVRIDPLF